MWWLLVARALAAGCDAKALKAELNAASPVAAPEVYVRLATCDGAAARSVATLALSKTLEGEKGWAAVLAALQVGAEAEVLAWVGKLEPDQRSRTTDWLGARCAAEPTVQALFVGASKSMGDAFWKERWYRGLAECRVPVVTDLLRAGLDHPLVGVAARDRAQFLGLVETFARNAQGGALPDLVRLVGVMKDPKEVRVVLSAFADAAGVGANADGKTAEASRKALVELGPTLPREATQAARDTLRALGAHADADAFVRYRWPDRIADGHLSWAVRAVETWTCKNGKAGTAWHTGLVRDPLARWPEEVEADVRAGVAGAWGLDTGERCKGTGTVDLRVSSEPVADGGAAFAKEDEPTLKELRSKVDKLVVESEDAWTLPQRQ